MAWISRTYTLYVRTELKLCDGIRSMRGKKKKRVGGGGGGGGSFQLAEMAHMKGKERSSYISDRAFVQGRPQQVV